MPLSEGEATAAYVLPCAANATTPWAPPSSSKLRDPLVAEPAGERVPSPMRTSWMPLLPLAATMAYALPPASNASTDWGELSA